ncbi:hypothetical protein ROJ8625_04062 [Roseivivax jejudonensis]|uniref:T6SS Phospholipase effector Tle1-like catalytic domain-containing protein n=1 Tax=Roseivivax jejudonensis TaxID=1529041 RepID=A0A1X7AD22_9RHOB|nr:hypothetical protein ROJ8625_04062 [Roseivivax jejudonensis]
MKRIVILCDGTWNRSDSKTPTNVVQLGQAVAPVATDGTVHVPIYIQGVGTGEGVTRLSRKLDAVLGGAFGWGLLDNIAEAYRHLVFLYKPGDEIYIFGFSRGAYTARSLTGFIRSTGIVNRDSLNLIPEAISRYRTLDQPKRTHPSSNASHDFRARLSPRVVTREVETDWRSAKGMPDVPRLRINFLGVWDSVGALGVPAHIPVLGNGRNDAIAFTTRTFRAWLCPHATPLHSMNGANHSNRHIGRTSPSSIKRAGTQTLNSTRNDSLPATMARLGAAATSGLSPALR